MRATRRITLALAAAFALAGMCRAADVSQIRYTSEAPFDADGKRVESVWKKADTCTRFIEVVTMNVALDQSEAQLLFDDKNLYASLTGFFDPKFDHGSREKSLFAGNNFEFFAKVGDGPAIQVAVDEFARLYVAKDNLEVQDVGVKASATRGKGRWTANLTIPFAALGCDAPKADAKARVGVFRKNINVHEKAKLYNRSGVTASGFTPNKFVYGVSDTWAEMTLTRSAGEPRRVVSPDMGYRINLFANHDFDIPGRGWQTFGGTTLQETQPMSGEWILHSSGKDYAVCAAVPACYKTNTQYTIVVKARGFGAGTALRVVEQRRDAAGRLREGVYPASLMPVGPDMHEYFIRYTSSKWEDLWRIVFIKVDNRAEDTGIDIASIKMYEGDISSFEIRKMVRPGRQAPVPGTELPVPPSAYGRMARPLRALVAVDLLVRLREPQDIFEGTGAEVDVIVTQGKDQDVYTSDGDPAAITKRLEKGEYDLYMVPCGCAGRIGKELAGKIAAGVEKGAGLYLEHSKNLLHFKQFEKGGVFGKGRVFLAKTAGGNHGYLPAADYSEYGKNFLPRRRLVDPQVVADAVETAFGKAAIPADAKTREEAFVYGGVRHVATWTLDAAGRTLAWRHEAKPLDGAKLGAFDDDGVTSSVAVEGDAAGLSVKWEFSDFSGRVLARGESPAAAKVSFRVPRERLYTNYGGIRLALVRGGALVDQRGECVFVTGNDRERLFSDYTPSVWPGTAPIEDITAMNRQLEEIGFRSAIIPTEGKDLYGQFLADGVSVGGSWLGAEYMHPARSKNRVRQPNYNNAHWRATAPGVVSGRSSKRAKFGVYQHPLCDEASAGTSELGGSFEFDAHPENLAEYRRRMEAKYGTIDEFNRRHRTAHKSFADVGEGLMADARASGNFAEFIEWRNFNVDRWCEALKLISDASHAGDPDAPFSMCETFGQSALSGSDYWRLLTRAGLGMSQEYTSMVYFSREVINNNDEVYRSFRPDMRVWGWTGYFFTPERSTFMPWWFAAHRYGGFSWFAATSQGYNIIDQATHALTVDGKELKASLRASRLLDGLGRVFLAYDWARRGIAIYYSHDAMLLATIRGPEKKAREIATKSPLHDFMYSRQGAQYLVEDLLYQHDYVAPEQMLAGKLAEYKVLLMPRINAMSDAEVAAVKAFLANGGKVVADELPGGWDELGVPRAQNPFKGVAGITVTGRNFDDLDKKQRAAALAFLAEAGVTPVLRSATIADVFGREAMHFTDGVNDVYAVIRHPARSQDTEEEAFEFVRGGFAWDVRARKPLGRVDRVTTKVPRADAVVYAVLPYEAKSVALAAPAKAKAGDVLSLDVKLEASGAAVGVHVFHVELVPPSGECRFHFKRNLTAAGGAAHLDFPLALNDEKGAWKVSAEDVFTGLRAERTVVVE